MELRVAVAKSPKLETLLTAGELHLAISEPSLMRRNPSARWQVPLERAAHKGFKVEQLQVLPLVLFERPCSWQDKMLDSLRRGSLSGIVGKPVPSE